MPQLAIIESPSILSITECLFTITPVSGDVIEFRLTYIITVDVLPCNSNLEQESFVDLDLEEVATVPCHGLIANQSLEVTCFLHSYLARS